MRPEGSHYRRTRPAVRSPPIRRPALEATARASLGWWHHSIENTIDKLDWTSMQDHLRVYAGWIWQLTTAAVVPLEFVSAADQFIERLTELRV